MIGITRRILNSIIMQTSPSCVTHGVLSTLITEVTAIINARPLVPISSDPEEPFLLTPASLLTQRRLLTLLLQEPLTTNISTASSGGKCSIWLTLFETDWTREYLPTHQSRSKWQDKHPNLKKGDLVLLKDNQVKRNEWQMDLVTKTFPDQDGMVRKIEFKVTRSESAKTFLRPVSEMILLKSVEDME